MSQPHSSPDQHNVNRWWTLPNVVTCFRIVNSPLLVALAIADRPSWVGAFAVLLVLTEWLDGFLARSLHQESAIGARLDTVADAIFYCSLLVAVVVLDPALVGREAGWIIAAISSYWLSWIASWIKFRRLPSYHTWAAKGVWLMVGVGIAGLLIGWSPWPFRIAMLGVVLTNLEAVAITLALDRCLVNVPSYWHLQSRKSRLSRRENSETG